MRLYIAVIGLLVLVVAALYMFFWSGDSDNSRVTVVPPASQGYQKLSEHLFSRSLNPPESKGDNGERSTRFHQLVDCGVDFDNYMDRSITNMLLETGSGLALGDYDGDGLVDIYFTGSSIDNRLFRNLGNLKFEDVTESANVNGRMMGTGLWASGASFADIDNDGDLDLYVCNMAAPDLLYVNQGDGTFLEEGFPRKTAYNGASKQANFCDYDQDGDLDFYLVTYQDIVEIPHEVIRERNGKREVVPGKEEYVAIIDGHEELWVGEQDLLYRNDGSGNFEEVARSSGIEGFDPGLASVWFDFDNDGWQDIYVTSDFKKPDHLYRNNGDGTFRDVLPDVVRRTPWFSMGVDAGDLNNDGKLDFLVADMADRTHFGQKLNMGDMADSGWFLTYGQPRQFMINCLFLNTGTFQFFEYARQAGLAQTNWTWSVRFADLDLDGYQDVFFTNGHARDNMNSDRALELKKFKEQNGGKELTFEQRNKHGIKVPKREETNLAFANRGDLKFESVGEEWGLDFLGVSHAAGFADLDLDGDLDCVINNYYSPSIVYENRTESGGRLLVELRSTVNNVFGVGSKVEIWQGDRYQRRDLMPGRGYLTSDPMLVHFGVDAAQPVSRMKVTWPDGRSQEFSDLSHGNLYRVIDSKKDEAESATQTENSAFVESTKKANIDFVHVENEFDDFEREPLLPYQLSRLGASVSCGDINDDGLPDLFFGGAAGQTGALFVRKADAYKRVSGPWEKHASREDMSCLFFDADGDGKTDLYVTSGSNEFEKGSGEYRDRLYLNRGQETFEDVSEQALPDLTESSMAVTAADFDRDGDLDLFVGTRGTPGKYPLASASHLLINERGKFSKADSSVVDLSDFGLVNSAIWSDFNNDGWMDLVVAREWQPVSFLENRKGEKLVEVSQEMGLAGKLGWWHGVAASDLDNDGDIDYVLTNQGKNTKYHASASHPHRLYYEDFDNNGSLDLVEAEFEGNTEYPIRGRSCSSNCMPFIGEKFKTFEGYSLASLNDIYGTEDQARPHVEVNYLESIVIWNEGDKFRAEALPSLAQISPGFGVVLRDFDGDGLKDIMMANNFFGSQPETGYMDGGLGLLLNGKRDRGYDALWPEKSGIVVPGDANGLAAGDFDGDGDQDVVFAVNNGAPKFFYNQNNFESTQITVEGPEGNKAAIGASLLLSFKSGKVQRYEISARTSYLSQSSSKVSIPLKAAADLETISVRWPDGSDSTTAIDGSRDDKSKIVISHQ